ncbi:MAG: GGDEF domain-containing protein [Afipia sp.]
MAADLLAGGTLLSAALLTTANLTGVATGHALFLRLPEANRRLRQPHSVLYLFLISTLAAAMAGFVGMIANPVLFGKGAMAGWSFWFATELVNYMTILPVVLSSPALSKIDVAEILRRNRQHDTLRHRLNFFLPTLGLVFSAILAVAIGGPGSVAFPIPALLWCALSYPIWATSILTLLFSLWILLLIAFEQTVPLIDAHSQSTVLSLRLGVALTAIGPLMVASVMATRNDLVQRLRRLASHDPLTGALNKRAFQELAHKSLTELAAQDLSVAVLMLDIDNFKRINDNYGHAAGDLVLTVFADVVRTSLREGDVVGRLGGEEFGVLLPYCSQADGRKIAERIRAIFANTSIGIPGGSTLLATVSIGVSSSEKSLPDFDLLLTRADAALYRAKRGGRNRVEEC